MTFTVPLGTWLLPATVSTAAWLWAWFSFDRRPASGYGDIGRGMANVMTAGIAIIISLIAWLIWAVAIILTGGAA